MTLWPIPSGEQVPGDFPPAFHGWLAWTFDPILSSVPNGGFNVSNGTMFGTGLVLPKRSVVTNVVANVKTLGATLTSGQNFAALYTAAGALVAQTADQSTAWTTTGLKTMALAGGPYNLPAGIYWAGAWTNGTTRPAFSGIDSMGWASISSRSTTLTTGVTTTAPTPITITGNSGGMWWFAIS